MRAFKIPAFLIILLAANLFLSGCSESSKVYSSPPEDFSLEDVGKIDIQLSEMGKLTKEEIDSISGVSFKSSGEGYDIKYRYFNSNITVKIVKFESTSKAERFWNKWIDSAVKVEPMNQDGALAVSYQTKHRAVIAWLKNNWLTYISVPSDIPNNKELAEQIKEYINYRYEEL